MLASSTLTLGTFCPERPDENNSARGTPHFVVPPCRDGAGRDQRMASPITAISSDRALDRGTRCCAALMPDVELELLEEAPLRLPRFQVARMNSGNLTTTKLLLFRCGRAVPVP